MEAPNQVGKVRWIRMAKLEDQVGEVEGAHQVGEVRGPLQMVSRER